MVCNTRYAQKNPQHGPYTVETYHIQLYVSLVKLHLEYAVQAWNPHLQAEIEKSRDSKEGLPEFQLILRN